MIGKVAFASVIACVGGTLFADASIVLDLTADRTLDVPAGEVTTVTRLTGGAYTLTKTGAGTLRIEAAYNRQAKIVVREGRLQTGVPVRPACLSSAWFHVDATVASTLTTESDGERTLVTEWRDADGGSVMASKNSSRPAPYLLPGGQNGRTVMDFGSLYNSSTATSGYGAFLLWSEACEHPVEMFVVVGDTEDAKAVVIDKKGGGIYYRNTPILGTYNYHSQMAPLIRNNPSAGAAGDRHSPLLLSAAGFGATYAKAQFRVDGASVTPTTYELPDGMHLVNVYGVDFAALDAQPSDAYTKAAYALNAFATERGNCFGGQRLGEVVILSAALTAEERTAVEDYLTAKWMPLTLAGLELADGVAVALPDGGQIVTPKCSRGAGVTIEGPGELVASVILGDDSIAVYDGRFTVDALRGEGSWFHVDASETATLTTVRTSGTNFVSRWNDVNGGAVYAAQSAAVPTWYKEMTGGATTLRCPWVETLPSGNLSVLNFGSLASWLYGASAASVVGWGGALAWSADCLCARDIFLVAGDTEDAKAVVKGSGSTVTRCQTLVGASTGTPLVRGNPPSGASGTGNSPLVLSSAAFSGARFKADGEVVDAKSFCPGDGLHLYEISDMPEEKLDQSSAQLNFFCREREYIFGGERIGECIVFTNKLDDVSRTRIRAALDTKWFGATPQEVVYEDLSVAAGSALRLAWQQAIVNGTLSLSGTLDVLHVVVGRLAVGTLGATVTGTLDLGTSGGTLDLADFPAKNYRRQTVRLISAGAVAGTVEGWTVSGVGKGAVRLALKSDGLYAEFLPSGLLVIAR